VTLVIDASVATKWLFHNKPAEQDVKQALAILRTLQNEEADAIQPPHWLVEVLSVVAREAPAFVEEALDVLKGLELPISTGAQVYRRAAHLSNQLKHHMFDTLYHAIALEHGAMLITADDIYFAKAFRLGNIKLLVNYVES